MKNNKKMMILKSLMMSGLWCTGIFGDIGSSQNALVKGGGEDQKSSTQQSLASGNSSIKNSAVQNDDAVSGSWFGRAKEKWSSWWNKKDDGAIDDNSLKNKSLTPEQIKERQEIKDLFSPEEVELVIKKYGNDDYFDTSNYNIYSGEKNPLLQRLLRMNMPYERLDRQDILDGEATLEEKTEEERQKISERKESKKQKSLAEKKQMRDNVKKISNKILEISRNNQKKMQEDIDALDKELSSMNKDDKIDIKVRNSKEYQKKALEFQLEYEKDLLRSNYMRDFADITYDNIKRHISNIESGKLVGDISYFQELKMKIMNRTFIEKKTFYLIKLQEDYYKNLLKLIEGYGENLTLDILAQKEIINNNIAVLDYGEKMFEETVISPLKNTYLVYDAVRFSMGALLAYWAGSFAYNQYKVNALIDDVELCLQEMEKEIRTVEQRVESGKTVVRNKSSILKQCNELKAVIKDIKQNFVELKHEDTGMFRRIWIRRSLGKLLSKFESTMKRIKKEFN